MCVVRMYGSTMVVKWYIGFSNDAVIGVHCTGYQSIVGRRYVCDQFRYCYWVIVHNRSTHWRQHCIRIAFSYIVKHWKHYWIRASDQMDWHFCLIHFSIVVHSNITMQPKAKELKIK